MECFEERSPLVSICSRVSNKTPGNLIIFGCFSLLHLLIRNFLFSKSPPILIISEKQFPPTLLFGTLVIFGTLEFSVCSSDGFTNVKFRIYDFFTNFIFSLFLAWQNSSIEVKIDIKIAEKMTVLEKIVKIYGELVQRSKFIIRETMFKLNHHRSIQISIKKNAYQVHQP